MAIVVSDTSPIRALNHLEILAVLERLYGRVYLPQEVADELRKSTRRFAAFDPGAFAFLTVLSPLDQAKVSDLEKRLDRGEAAALVLAIEQKADLVLIDERSGRQVARELGLSVIGALGILVQAKDHGLVSDVRLLIDRLQKELDFYLSPVLVKEVLKRAGES